MAFKLGMLLGLSIIISIGAQNLFVIQQAMRNEYTYISALTCFICDFILILAGVAGVSAILLAFPILKSGLLILGIAFFIWYGIQAFKRGFTKNTVNEVLQSKSESISLTKIILLGLSFSILNPAAILDTVVIIGSSANHYADMEKYLFVAGTISASFVWFFGLASISSYFAKRGVHTLVWRGLDFASGVLMLALAFNFVSKLG